MCGLVGIVTSDAQSFRAKKLDIFEQMLFADILRGVDSTGVALVDAPGNVFTYKRALPAYDFLGQPFYRKMINRVSPRVMMGHNRAATYGTISNHFAHPFTHGNITLAHNGTLQNHKSLPDGHRFTVDSEYIAYSINEFGVEQTLKSIQGSFALTWYDSETGKFNLVKNNHRPLGYSFLHKGKTLVYASEGDMMHWVIERNGETADDGGFWYEFDDKILYTIDPSNPKDWEEKEVELYVPPKYNTKKGKNSNQKSGSDTHKTGNSKKDSIVLPFTGAKKTPPVDALQKLDLVRGSRVELEIEDADSEIEAILYSVKGLDVPDYWKVEAIYFYTEAKELDWAYEHVGDTIVATVAGAREDSSTEFTLYLDEILEAKEEPTEKKPSGNEDTGTDLVKYDRGDEQPASILAIYKGPNKSLLTAVEFAKITQNGCCHCSQPIPLRDHARVVYTIDNQPICGDCVQDFHSDATKNGMPGFLEH